ncbi:hypothetical protein BGZ99_010370 [Dissophora globulifera]|uniref:Uncharacterized protein n=1 Tax=Dissophora globulifera TaxID=979702 RepID=A0A9P6UM72_9FUNG|nr:hypothetical protein BGZ99_010370 [Dissophora globulifera]
MPDLPFDCIARAIEWVDSRQDLFNLLTVSKDIFPIAARRLYRDPIKSRTATFDDSVRKLVLLLLSLSPAGGERIDRIRQSNGLPPSGIPLDPPPMLDYLSLVKVVRWKGRIYRESQLMDVLGYWGEDLYMLLTWAFVGHRLDGVEEVEIDVEHREHYLDNAAKMTSLRKIWTRFGDSHDYKHMYDFSEAMIKAIQLHHGLYQLRECHMIPNPLVRGPGASDYDNEFREIDISGAQRVLSHLPPPRHYLTLPRPDGSTISLDQLFDPYMETIQDMSSMDAQYSALVWKAMIKAYAGQSPSQVLQRLRGMTSLNIDPETANGNDENLLAWATCEAKHHYHRPGGRQQVPLVPLQKLYIGYDGTDTNSTAPRARATTAKWKILQDGLLGFSGTLNCLSVLYPRSVDGMVDRSFTVPRPLHKLKALFLREMVIDPSVWDLAPNIERLSIRFSFPLFEVPAATAESQNDQNAIMTPMTVDTTTTTAAAGQQPQCQLPEFSFHCPRLTHLTLEDRAISLLDPNCLHHSPNLQKLEFLSGSLARKRIVDEGGDSDEAQVALRVLYPTRWTWDWSFPMLKRLTLQGDLHEFGFSLAILRSCPILSWIELTHRDATRRFPLRSKGILDVPLDNNNQKLPFTQSKLEIIHFANDWDIDPDELSCLLQALPGLKTMCMVESVRYAEGLGDRELIDITKSHPVLSHVVTNMVRTTEPASALGLSDIRDRYREETEAGIGVMYDGDGNAMPRKRRWVDYEFQGYGRHSLRLF